MIKELAYRLGFRPKVGSIFYSHDCDILYSMIDCEEIEVQDLYEEDQ